MSTFYEHRPEKLYIGAMTEFPYPLHVHEVVEIIAVTAGTALVSIGGEACRLDPGDVAVVFPLIPHSFDEVGADTRGITAIFPPDIIPEYGGTFRGMVPDEPVLRAGCAGPDSRLAVSRLQELSMEADLPLCMAYLHLLLAGTIHSFRYRPVYDYNERNLGARIIHYISDHACEDITLESAARALGISVSHLSHFFAQKMRINFRRFINAIRIEKARLLMRDPNLTLTVICGACGFNNMRTFRRAFLQEIGCLPSELQLSLRNRVASPSGGHPAAENPAEHG